MVTYLILANNLPVAKGTVVVQGNRIAVEVRELLPRAPDVRYSNMLWRSGNKLAGKQRQVRRLACWGAALSGSRTLYPRRPICYSDRASNAGRFRPANILNAAMAELVDALA